MSSAWSIDHINKLSRPRTDSLSMTFGTFVQIAVLGYIALVVWARWGSKHYIDNQPRAVPTGYDPSAENPGPRIATHTTTGEPCLTCGKMTTARCSKCGLIYACSKKHAKQGWKKHKSMCKSPYNHPTKQIKAYLLPVDEEKPHLVSIDCELCPSDDPEDPEETGYDNPLTCAKRLLKCQMVEITALTTSGNVWVWGSGPRINLISKDCFRFDGSPLNQCVQHITGGRAPYPWAGSLLVMKEPDGTSERFEDVDEKALETVKGWLYKYNPRW